MKPALYQEVALTRDIPTQQRKQGDIAVLIDYVPHPTGSTRSFQCNRRVDRCSHRSQFSHYGVKC